MNNPEIKCNSCGSTRLKRSRSTSLLELPKMALGTYPFRCLDCKARSWINVWSLAKRRGVVCPRCLNSAVYHIEPERLRLGFWGMVRRTIGAEAYQCGFCGARFLASTKRKRAAKAEAPSQIEDTTHPSQPKVRAAAAAD